MLNLIRCVAICFVALFLSACTTTGEKRGYVVKTAFYEFACSQEPSETKLDPDALKIGAELLAKAITTHSVGGVVTNGGGHSSSPASVDDMVKVTKELIGDCKKFIE